MRFTARGHCAFYFRSYRSQLPSKSKVKQWDDRSLHKLAVRLLKLYQVADHLCPNITTTQSVKAMRYLLYKKYIEVVSETSDY